jgi:hypothetical protein
MHRFCRAVLPKPLQSDEYGSRTAKNQAVLYTLLFKNSVYPQQIYPASLLKNPVSCGIFPFSMRSIRYLL